MDARDSRIDLMTELHTLQNAQLQIEPLINAIELGDRIGAVEILMQLIDIAQTGDVLDDQQRGFVFLPWQLLTPEQRSLMWVAGTQELARFAAAD